jgi:hypothetical protein
MPLTSARVRSRRVGPRTTSASCHTGTCTEADGFDTLRHPPGEQRSGGTRRFRLATFVRAGVGWRSISTAASHSTSIAAVIFRSENERQSRDAPATCDGDTRRESPRPVRTRLVTDGPRSDGGRRRVASLERTLLPMPRAVWRPRPRRSSRISPPARSGHEPGVWILCRIDEPYSRPLAGPGLRSTRGESHAFPRFFRIRLRADRARGRPPADGVMRALRSPSSSDCFTRRWSVCRSLA